MRSRHQDSFKIFEANTSDAWDDGDDDLMKLASAARQQLSQKNIKSPSTDGVKLTAGNTDSVNVSSLSSELPAHFVSSSGMDNNSSLLVLSSKVIWRINVYFLKVVSSSEVFFD